MLNICLMKLNPYDRKYLDRGVVIFKVI